MFRTITASLLATACAGALVASAVATPTSQVGAQKVQTGGTFAVAGPWPASRRSAPATVCGVASV